MQFKNKNIQISTLIIGIVAIGGFFAYQTQQKEGANQQPPSAETQAKAWPDKLTLDVKFGKDSYAVGEAFKGQYYLKYDGPAFDGVILYCAGEERLRANCAVVKGRIEDVDFGIEGRNDSLRAIMSAYTIDENLGRMPAKSFDDPGKYTFSMAVFDCFYIEKGLNQGECGGTNIDPKLLADAVQPIKWVTKDIQITGK